MTRKELTGLRKDFFRYSIKGAIKNFFLVNAKHTTRLQSIEWNGRNLVEVGRFVDEWVYGYYDENGEYERGFDCKLEVREGVLYITLSMAGYSQECALIEVPMGATIAKGYRWIEHYTTYHWVEVVPCKSKNQ